MLGKRCKECKKMKKMSGKYPGCFLYLLQKKWYDVTSKSFVFEKLFLENVEK